MPVYGLFISLRRWILNFLTTQKPSWSRFPFRRNFACQARACEYIIIIHPPRLQNNFVRKSGWDGGGGLDVGLALRNTTQNPSCGYFKKSPEHTLSKQHIPVNSIGTVCSYIQLNRELFLLIGTVTRSMPKDCTR